MGSINYDEIIQSQKITELDIGCEAQPQQIGCIYGQSWLLVEAVKCEIG